jgi:hypothetical protein
MSSRSIRADAFATNGSTNCIHSGLQDVGAPLRSDALALVVLRYFQRLFPRRAPSEPKQCEQVGAGDAEEAV